MNVLSVSELSYRRLFEHARDGFMLLDPATRRIIDINSFFADLLGYTRDELVGEPASKIGLFPDEPDAASPAAWRELEQTGMIRCEDLPLQGKDGRHVEVEFIGRLFPQDTPPLIHCEVRDNAGQKKTAAALRAAEMKCARQAEEVENLVSSRTAELRFSNQQLEKFAYSIAHELRTPLRSMQGFAQLLGQEHAKNLGQPGREYVSCINKAAEMMDQLLADLLALSLISQQKIELAPVALEPVVQSALSGCETEIMKSEAHVESGSPWPAVVAHAATLHQVLMRLIGNAVKFVAGREPQVRLRTEERPAGIVRIWVEDNGIGIPPECHQRIFQTFQRLHATSYAGTGIGLAIVKKGVERMGGRVGLESVPGEGSRFWIDLAKATAVAAAS